jgi:hypothetical protein
VTASDCGGYAGDASEGDGDSSTNAWPGLGLPHPCTNVNTRPWQVWSPVTVEHACGGARFAAAKDGKVSSAAFAQEANQSRQQLTYQTSTRRDKRAFLNARVCERRGRVFERACTCVWVSVVFCCVCMFRADGIVVSCMLAHTRHPAPPAGHGRGRVGREVGVSLLAKPETRLICRGYHKARVWQQLDEGCTRAGRGTSVCDGRSYNNPHIV